jgi:hypothetical protein
MSTTKFITLTLTTVFGLTFAAPGDDTKSTASTNKLPPASTKQGVTYAVDIKPVFDNSCVKCHSGDKPKGGLKLDSLIDALKGGRDGKVIVVGDSAKSPLVLSAAHLTGDQDLWMPPLQNKAGIAPLTPGQIGLLRAWIDQGAK